jgi:hypothetical protein
VDRFGRICRVLIVVHPYPAEVVTEPHTEEIAHVFWHRRTAVLDSTDWIPRDFLLPTFRNRREVALHRMSFLIFAGSTPPPDRRTRRDDG